LPDQAERLFARHLADSRRAAEGSGRDETPWRYALVCAVTPDESVFGGVYLDIGPIGGAGPLALENLAYIERTVVRRQHRRKGLATRLMYAAIGAARDAGRLYLRCSNNWNNKAERRLLVTCGFALVNLDGESDEEPCYLSVRPVCDSGDR
jgi:GNAT superfamily N-acetyltransferase